MMMSKTPILHIPKEPSETLTEIRATYGKSQLEALHLVNDGNIIARYLWKEWHKPLTQAGLTYNDLLRAVRGYRQEFWLWVMGERPWDHCVVGTAGRLARRVSSSKVKLEIEDLDSGFLSELVS
ncbi:hypothetical protein Tter_1335 [Thermobaculum terrenum ATCC BAA-798]|uniref:Uncharacterized protein n=1 Tax=Thermobaculum terrenum (strain ATCC BAA-798 / CCMEE 7001 / YNP1) TaxID=525904 RepID=D1CBS7_THET1|nr:hypothetical protein [Thermobaculum terrenum]ACZ42242.1 hypothetical protein Tter_1335 [Thermobaculum terrenum ATCC BAA-798]